ncbi:MAG TPA: polysaccharide pyruvyl transferase CsaB [bacterium]|nr:polysaccharide pyruvyl transferase CsaB [bacterium]
MSRIVISGYYGFDNLGDEAVLAATVQELRRRRPDAEIAVLSAAPDATARTHGIRGVARTAPGAIAGVLRGADLLLCGGGSLFQDATSWRSPWYYLGVLSLGRRLARRTAVHAQGIEPPTRATVRAGVAYVVDRVDLVTLRDRTSQSVLASLGVRRPRIVVSADPSWLLEPDWSAAAVAERARWGAGPRFGLALRAWGSGAAVRAAVAAARAVTARLGVRWVLLPMHRPWDLAVADEVAGELGDIATVVRAPLGPREILALVGALDVLVGMRLHALLFAAAQGVPIVPVAYDPKVTALARELGEPDPAGAESIAPDDLVASIDRAVAERAANRARLLAAAAPLRDRAKLAPALAADLLA